MQNYLSKNRMGALMTILILAVGSISIIATTHPVTASQIGKLCVFFACGSANITAGGTSSSGGGGQPTPTPGKLIVIKEVSCPSGIQCKSPTDFQIKVTGNNPNPSTPFPGSNVGTEVTLDPGEFQVTEQSAPANYLPSFSGQCDAQGKGTIAAGETKTCTVTNTFQSG